MTTRGNFIVDIGKERISKSKDQIRKYRQLSMEIKNYKYRGGQSDNAMGRSLDLYVADKIVIQYM